LTQESEIFNDSFLLDFSEFHPGYHEIHDRLFKLRGLPGRYGCIAIGKWAQPLAAAGMHWQEPR
jgi:hypothetical protein